MRRGNRGQSGVAVLQNLIRNAEHLDFAWPFASRFAIIRKGAE